MKVDQEQIAQRDHLLAAGRFLLYAGLALSSLLVLRGPASFTIGDYLIAGAAGCALLSLRKPPRNLPGSIYTAGILLLLGGVFASAVASDLSGSLLATVRLLYLAVVIPWTFLMLLLTPSQVARAAACWVAGAAVAGAGAVMQLVAGDVIPGGDITNAGRFTGFTASISDLGGITAVGAAAALAALNAGLSRRAQGAAVTALALCLVGLVLSGSVSGMIALAAAAAVLLIRRGVQLRKLIMVGAVATAVLAAVLNVQAQLGALGPIERLMQATGITATSADLDTASTRAELANQAWIGIEAQPILGHGMGLADNILFGSFTVHNIFLAGWHAGGILTLLGLVVATSVAVRFGWARSPGDQVREGLVAASVAALVFAQTAPSFYNRYYWLPLGLLITAELARRRRAVSPSACDRSQVAHPPSRGRLTRP